MRRVYTVITVLLLASTASAAELPPELSEVIEQARSESLPAEVLASKAGEGLSKGIPVSRVKSVIESQLGDLRHASKLMGSQNPELVTATARAVRSGATDKAVLRIQQSPTEIRVRAITSLGDLLALGFSESDAVRLVLTATSSLQPDVAVSQLAPAAAALVTRKGSTEGITNELNLKMAVYRTPLSTLPADTHPGNNGNNNAYGHLATSPGKSGEHRKK